MSSKHTFSLFLTPILALSLITALCGCSDPHQEAVGLMDKANQMRSQAVASEEKDKKPLWKPIIEVLQEATELDPLYVDAQIALTSALWEHGQQVEAIRKTDTLVEQFSDSADAWSLRGQLQLNLSQYQKAGEAFLKAIELGGDEAPLLMQVGACYGKTGDFESAFDIYDRAMELGESKDVVYFNLGLCYEGTEGYELALENYLLSLEANSNYLPVLKQLIIFYRERTMPGTPDLDKALIYAKKAYEIASDDIKVLADIADIYLIKKDYASSMKIIKEALELEPNNESLRTLETGVQKMLDLNRP